MFTMSGMRPSRTIYVDASIYFSSALKLEPEGSPVHFIAAEFMVDIDLPSMIRPDPTCSESNCQHVVFKHQRLSHALRDSTKPNN